MDLCEPLLVCFQSSSGFWHLSGRMGVQHTQTYVGRRLTWWFPTNKSGRSLGMPARPGTTVPSSSVEKNTGLVAFCRKLDSKPRDSEAGPRKSWQDAEMAKRQSVFPPGVQSLFLDTGRRNGWCILDASDERSSSGDVSSSGGCPLLSLLALEVRGVPL
jgi:hypothetical protein